MKGKRRLSGVLLIIAALVIMQLPVSEADAATSASDFRMEGTTLVKYTGTATKVSIPNTVEVIAENAFEENDKIERIVIPDSVIRIDAFAFWGCDNLQEVVLGKGLMEVGDYVFANCKGLKQMTLPENIRSIGIQSFADCVNMSDITIPPQVTSIHDTAFDGCSKLYIHCEPGSVADNYAEEFYQKQMEMPEYEDVPDYDSSNEPTDSNGESEGDDSNYAPEVDLRKEGTVIGTTQIVGNQAVVFIDNTSIDVLGDISDNTADVGSNAGDADVNESITNEEQDIENGAIPKYTIVDGRVVADQAYYKNKSLNQVTLPNGIEEIGQFAFARSSLRSVEIPEGVTDICYGAFYHADNLENVKLPSTIENVEPKAFSYSKWVEDFLVNGTEDFLISANVLVAYRGTAEEVIIPDGVTVIAGEVFLNHTEIKSVTIPNSVLTIGEGAFEGCSSLTDIKLGRNLIQMKDRAFAGCPITKSSVPASVQEMGLMVFDEAVKRNIVYEVSGVIQATHETSAERLSNEKYRNVTEDHAEAGVTVTGIAPYFVTLEGASRNYTLTVKEAEDSSSMADAYQRVYQTDMPGSMVVYDMQLTDNSEIPITKLGKQVLTVMIPVPEALAQENIIVYTLDRNGQLEKLESTRVLLDGVDAISFKTTHLSLFGFCGDGSTYDAENILEITTTIESMSAGPGIQNGRDMLVLLKWILSIALLFTGGVFILDKGRKITKSK
uniref:leucine-rich repeat domain-containing protein n=1 Tax=Acetatifactor sp. TaxID=1872090 RepID=UPI004057C263